MHRSTGYVIALPKVDILGCYAGCTVEYREISPPPPPKKNGPCLNERIDVIMNAAACYSLKSCWSTSSFLEFRNRCAEALTSTKIRSFKHGPFFLGGGGGNISRYSTVIENETGPVTNYKATCHFTMHALNCSFDQVGKEVRHHGSLF